MSKTISVSMSDDDFKRISKYCNLHELTRSKFMVQSTIEKVDVSDLVDGMSALIDLTSKLSDMSNLSDEDIEDLRNAIKMVGRR